MNLHLDPVATDDLVECLYNGPGVVESADGQITVAFNNGRVASYNSSGVCQTERGVPSIMNKGLGTLMWWDARSIMIPRKDKTVVLRNTTVTVGA